MCTDDDVVICVLYGSPALAEVVASMFGFPLYLPDWPAFGAVANRTYRSWEKFGNRTLPGFFLFVKIGVIHGRVSRLLVFLLL